MGEEQREALLRLFAGDEDFRTAMVGASSVDEAVRIANEHGLGVAADDFAPPEGMELSAAELEQVTGGAMTGMGCTNGFYSCGAWCGGTGFFG